jgi:hypothetical protein
MKPRRNAYCLYLAVAGVVLNVATAWSMGEPAPCALKPGMYDNRVRLEHEYARVWERNGHTIGPNTKKLRELRRELDRGYLAFMESVATLQDQNDKASVTSCCATAKNDPVASLFCPLLSYLAANRTNHAAFVASLPRSGRRLEAFWRLDEILGVDGELPALPSVSTHGEGLIDRFVDELYHLVAGGDRSAADKYLALYAAADGEAAGKMRDQLERLFEEHSDIVLRNWSTFRRYRVRLASISEGLSPKRSEEIRQKLLQHCNRSDRACKEILEVLR